MSNKDGRSGRPALIFGLADQILSSGSNVIMLLAVARVAEVGEFGLIGLMIIILTTGLSIVRGGINTPVMLLGSAPKLRLNSEIRAGILIALILGLAIGAVLFGTGAVLGVPSLALPLALSAPVVFAQDVHRYASMTVDNGKSAILFDGLWAGVSLIVLALTFILPVTVQMVLWCWLLGAFASAFGLTIASRLVASSSGLRAWWSVGTPDRLRYAAEAAIGAGPALTLAAFVTVFIGPTATAALRGAGTLMGPISLVLSAIPMAVIPRAVRDLHTAEETWLLLRKLAIAMSTFSILTGLIASSVPSTWGRVVLGKSWAGAAPLLPFTGLEYAALAWLYCSWAAFRASGRSRVLLWTRLTHVVITSSLSLTFAIVWRTALSAAIGLAVGAIAAMIIVLIVRIRLKPASG